MDRRWSSFPDSRASFAQKQRFQTLGSADTYLTSEEVLTMLQRCPTMQRLRTPIAEYTAAGQDGTSRNANLIILLFAERCPGILVREDGSQIARRRHWRAAQPGVSACPSQEGVIAMSMAVSIEARSDYLNVLVTGSFEVQPALDLLAEVLDASVHHKLSRILVDYRELQGIPSAMIETYIYSASGATLVQQYVGVVGESPRMAYLGPRTERMDGYGERVSAEYGFHDVKVTTDADEALGWLGVSGTGANRT